MVGPTLVFGRSRQHFQDNTLLTTPAYAHAVLGQTYSVLILFGRLPTVSRVLVSSSYIPIVDTFPMEQCCLEASIAKLAFMCDLSTVVILHAYSFARSRDAFHKLAGVQRHGLLTGRDIRCQFCACRMRCEKDTPLHEAVLLHLLRSVIGEWIPTLAYLQPTQMVRSM